MPRAASAVGDRELPAARPPRVHRQRVHRVEERPRLDAVLVQPAP